MIDCHVHFIDASRFRYPIFPQRSAGFEALVGDYSALPRRYLPADYLADAAGLHIDRTVWAEFMSSTPLEELRWAQSLADGGRLTKGEIKYDKDELQKCCPTAFALLERLRGRKRRAPIRAETFKIMKNCEWKKR
jgi:predicted TIM-barrel fold metal-dependent hydrolase